MISLVQVQSNYRGTERPSKLMNLNNFMQGVKSRDNYDTYDTYEKYNKFLHTALQNAQGSL